MSFESKEKLFTEIDDYIKVLQENLRNHLISCKDLLSKSAAILYQTENSADDISSKKNIDYSESIKQISRKITDVMELQIRVTIVAPMKAGKSTIINALIGDDFLPIRVDAMTALPTAVVLKLGQNYNTNNSPVELILHEKTLNALRILQSSVSERLTTNFMSDGLLRRLLNENSHLISMAEILRDNKALLTELQSKITDRECIQSTLTFINDLVRLAIYLSKGQSHSPISLDDFRDNIPIINVYNSPIQNTQHRWNRPCQVLFIDTPGPDEADASTELREIVRNELQRADMIFTLMEYGHINTEAGQAIANDISKIRNMRNNQDCIYVLISKIDQYQRKDMSKEDLFKHVAFVSKVPVDRVFEMSGRYALIAQKFLNIYQRSQENNAEICVRSCEMAKDVLEAYCPAYWEEELQINSSIDVKNKAERLYARCGLVNILNTAVSTVVGQVVHRCIKSAIDTCNTITIDVLNDVVIRLSGLELIQGRLQKEIEDLNEDLKFLSEMKQNFESELNQITKILEQKLTSIFQTKADEYEKTIENMCDRENSIVNDPKLRAQQRQRDCYEVTTNMTAVAMSAMTVGRTGQHVGGVIMGGLGILTGAVIARMVTNEITRLIYGRDDEISFDSVDTAEKFINRITKDLNEKSQEIYSTIDESVKESCRTVGEEFHNRQKQQTTVILERANARLQSTFNIRLIIPKQSQFKYEKVNFNTESIERIETSWLWQIYRRLVSKEDQCFISCIKLQQACTESMKEHLKRIQKGIVEETIKGMREKLISFFTELHAHLRKYKGYAKLCLSDKLLDHKNQALFKLQLQELKGKWEIMEKDLEELDHNIDWSKLTI